MDRTEASPLSDREVMILRGMYDMADHPPKHLREYHRMQYVLGYLLAEGERRMLGARVKESPDWFWDDVSKDAVEWVLTDRLGAKKKSRSKGVYQISADSWLAAAEDTTERLNTPARKLWKAEYLRHLKESSSQSN